MSPPFAIIAIDDITTLSTRLMSAYTLWSVIKFTCRPAYTSFYAVLCPVNIGAVSQTSTSKSFAAGVRYGPGPPKYANFRKAIKMSEYPNVRTTSFALKWSKA